MKKTNRALPAAAVALGAILLLGCPLFSPHGSFGRVRLSLGTGEGAKTILPVIEVDSYLIAFSGPAAVDPVSTAQANPTIELPVGTWDISVEGKDAGGDTVAVGGASGVVVSEGTTTPVAIVLSAQASGTGTIDVTVTWPVGVTPPIDADKTTVTLDEAADPGTLTFGSTWVRYVKAKPAGSYRLCLTLVSVATPRASVQEAVQVYGNLTSSATIALTSADFLFPPTPPSGLAVAEGLGALELSWTDTSHVETGYVVERSTTGLPLDFYALGSPLPANTEGYHDADASASVTYWYRVKATNSLGDSGYSNVGSGKVEAPVAGASGALSFSATTTSSIRVSWVKATDNVSAQAVLEYRVVRSLADDVRHGGGGAGERDGGAGLDAGCRHGERDGAGVGNGVLLQRAGEGRGGQHHRLGLGIAGYRVGADHGRPYDRQHGAIEPGPDRGHRCSEIGSPHRHRAHVPRFADHQRVVLSSMPSRAARDGTRCSSTATQGPGCWISATIPG